MKIGIAGVRGSIPTPAGNGLFGREVNTAKYGGNTTCVYVAADDGSQHVLDAGTGIRDLGVHLAREGGFNGQGKQKLNLYISHTHWDHIQGLPFFVPAYIPGNNIVVFGEAKVRGVHPDIKQSLEDAIGAHSDQPGNELSGVLQVEGDGMRRVLEKQQDFRNFPAPLEALQGIKLFCDFIAGATIYETPTLKIDTMPLNHPGNSISYKFVETKEDGTTKTFVFSTDFEPNGNLPEMTEYWRDADLVLADGQYEPKDSPVKGNPFMEGWGHSDYQTDLELAAAAGVKRLALVHLEPKMGDEYYDDMDQRAKEAAAELGEVNGQAVAVEVAKEGNWYEL